MRFDGFVYLAFLIASSALFWILPARFRSGWLLGSSYLFYASWNPQYLVLLVGLGAFNWWGARWIDGATSSRRRRGFCVAGFDVLVLATCKYLGWLAGGLGALFSRLGLNVDVPIPGWVLPLGISFYTCESISYVLDVARKREKPRPFWQVQLFLAFFPKLMAGPIMRAHELFPQLEAKAELRAGALRLAVRDIVIGLFFKIVLSKAVTP